MQAQTQQPPREVKIPYPEPFNGDSRHVDEFLMKLNLIFATQPRSYENEAIKIAVAINLLTGDALKWAVPLVNSRDSRLGTWPSFSTLLQDTFKNPQAKYLAEQELLRMRQGKRPVSKLVVEFKRAANDAGWTGPVLHTTFYNTLNDDVKDEISKLERPVDIEEYYRLAVKIDTRLHERRVEKQYSSRPSHRFYIKKNETTPNYTPNFNHPTFISSNSSNSSNSSLAQAPTNSPTNIPAPMELGNLQRRKLSPEEKKRRFENQLCLYCGEGGHKVDGCPAKAKNSAQGKNVQA